MEEGSGAERRAPGESRWNRIKAHYPLIVLVCVYFLVHAVKNFFIPPYVDETYWWLASRHLEAGYFIHPPWFAVEMRFFTAVFGSGRWGVKSVSLFFSTAFLVMAYFLSREIFREKRQAFLTALVLAVWPITNCWLILGHHDATFSFLTLLTLFLLWRALSKERSLYWYLTGVSAGFLLLTKEQAALTLGSIFLFLVVTREGRRWLKRKEPYLAFAILVVMFIPTLLWYAKHDFEPIIFQLTSRPGFLGNDLAGYIREVVSHVVWQLAMYSPFVYLFSLFGVIASGYLARKESDRRFTFLFWLSAPTIAFFTVTGGRYYWSVPADVIAIIAAVPALHVLVSRSSRRLVHKGWFPAFLLTLVLIPLAFSVFINVFKAYTSGQHNGWQELAAAVEDLRQEMPGDRRPFFMSPYFTISCQTAFYQRDRLAGYTVGFRVYESEIYCDNDRYNPWVPLERMVGKDVIFVDDLKNPDDFETPVSYWEEKLPRYFERVDPPVIVEYERWGMLVHRFYVFRCYGFKGEDGEMNAKGEVREYVEGKD